MMTKTESGGVFFLRDTKDFRAANPSLRAVERRGARSRFLLIVVLSLCGLSAAGQVPAVRVDSSLLGGKATDDCDGIAVDAERNVYLACHSDSDNLSRPANVEYKIRGDLDAFVIKLSPQGKVLYLAHFGGTAWESATGIVVDRAGNAYVTGTTYSSDFPVTANATQRAFGGASDAFVLKLGPKGDVLFLTFLGGSAQDDGTRVALSRTGDIYVTGSTSSGDFPVTPGALGVTRQGESDAFVARLDANGRVVFSTRVGGTGNERAFAVAADRDGNAIVTGNTTSKDFPIVRGFQSMFGGVADIFVAKLNREGSALLCSTYLGGEEWEVAQGVAVDHRNDVFVAGSTRSGRFPTTERAFQRSNRGIGDVVLAKLSSSLAELKFSTYLGGKGNDTAHQVVPDRRGGVTIVGSTESPDFPLVEALQTNMRGTNDAFVAHVDWPGARLRFSTYFGGSKRELFEDAVYDSHGDLYISGLTSSADFPVSKPLQSAYAGDLYDIVLLRISFKAR